MRKICLIIASIMLCLWMAGTASAVTPISSSVTATGELHVGDHASVTYQFTGGNGQYSDINIAVQPLFGVDGTAVWIGETVTHQPSTGSGSISVDCPAATAIGFRLSCTDAVTGEQYLEYHDIPLKTNPAFPVSFTWDKDEYQYGDPMTVSWQIGGNPSGLKNSKIIWGGFNNHGNIDFPYEQEITSSSGKSTFTPISGEDIFVYIQAEDEKGNIIFAQSETKKIITNENSHPIQSEVTATGDLHVGDHASVTYQFTGGSGQYSNIKIAVQPLLGVNTTGKWIGETVNHQLDTGSGTISVDCPAATAIGFRLSCTDVVTGEQYSKYHDIPLKTNPAFPVSFTWDKDEYQYGDNITVSWQIGGNPSNLKNSKIIWGYFNNLGNMDFPYEQEITSSSGTSSYTATTGKDIFVYIQAEDDKGNIIFGQSETKKISENGSENQEEKPEEEKSGIPGFVTRCYRLILGREPDADGLNYWTQKLASGEATAAEIINGFVNSDEFRNKNLSNDATVDVFYHVMLDRDPDEEGKNYWSNVLNGEDPYVHMINGFCNSVEFRGICEAYGITPGSINSGNNSAPAPAPAPAADMNKIRAFVTRNYRVILGREPDADGLNYWAQRLASGEATAAEIINGFITSDEFKSKNLSYGDQVEVLYQVMLDRGSDAVGKAYWVSMLNGGNPLAAIINGFCNSVEFKGICAEYGITPGSVNAGEAKPPREEAQAVDLDKIRAYVSRCYRIILSREPDQGGLDYWTGKMASGELEAAAIIDQFVNSIEFKGKQLSNRDAVEVLYQAMLGRGSDEAGMGYWIARLEAGEPFAVIINGFCNSVEFKGICAEYGITPGSVAVASVTTYAKPEEEEETPEQTPGQEPEQALEQTPEQAPAEPAPADERTEKARVFVTHCYRSALFREPNTEEIDYYTEKILSGQMTAKDVARAFAFSQEFQSKWTDSTAFVRVLYRLCLDREADADGLVYWTDKLANGETAAAVFNALTENKEFVQICATYGVPAGVDANAIRAQEEAAAAEAEANEAPAAPASEFTNGEKIRAFVSRFYRDAMGREADEEGLNYYTGRILNGEATPKDVAGEIILSEEFRGRMPGNEELVRILYRVYLGREADEEGLANWAGQLDSGATLETILNGFAGSEEFAVVVSGLK